MARTPPLELAAVLGPDACAELGDEIAKYPEPTQASLYAAILQGLRIRDAFETLSPTWCKDRDDLLARVRRDVRHLLRHVMGIPGPHGAGAALDLVAAVVVEVMLEERRRLEERSRTHAGEFAGSFDEYVEDADAQARAMREQIREAFGRALEERNDLRGSFVETLLKAGPLKGERRRGRTATVDRGQVPKPRGRGGFRPGSGRRVAEGRRQAFMLLRRAGAGIESAEWILDRVGLTKSRRTTSAGKLR